MNNHSLTIVVSLIQLLITGATFLFGVVMAYYFGASSDMDAYVISANVISIAYALFVTSQTRVLIPFLGGINDVNKRKRVISSLIQSNSIFSLIIVSFLYFSADYLVVILAPGLSSNQIDLAVHLLRLTTLYLFFTNLIALGKSVVEFYLQPILSLFIRFAQVLLLLLFLFLLSKPLGIISLPVSYILSAMLILPIYTIYLYKKSIPFYSKLPIWNEHTKEYIKLLYPILVGQLLMRAIKISDSYLASFLDEGALSHLNYALRIVANFDQLFMGVYIVYFPLLAKINKSGENKKHIDTFYSGFETLFLVALGLALFTIIFAPEMIRLIFQRGNFLESDTSVVSNLLRAYSVMLICAPLGNYFANIYFSRKASKTASIFSVISSVTNIILNIIFIRIWGVYGLAVASSIAYLLGNILQVTNIYRINSEFKLTVLIQNMLPSIITIFISSAIILFIKTLCFYPNMTAVYLFMLLFTMFIIYCIFALIIGSFLKLSLPLQIIMTARKKLKL